MRYKNPINLKKISLNLNSNILKKLSYKFKYNQLIIYIILYIIILNFKNYPQQ